MIPSKRKLNHSLFEVVLKKGRNFYSESFSLKTSFLSTGNSKFSVVVSKKLEKSAVKRNAIKRRVYSLITPFLSLAKPGLLCAFFMKRKVAKQDMLAVTFEIETILKKAGVIG